MARMFQRLAASVEHWAGRHRRPLMLAAAAASAGCCVMMSVIPMMALSQANTCITKVIYYEAGKESVAGQLAVAQVVINRLNSGRFGESVCEVIAQPGQFTFDVRNDSMRGSADWKRLEQISKAAIKNDISGIDDDESAVLFGSFRPRSAPFRGAVAKAAEQREAPVRESRLPQPHFGLSIFLGFDALLLIILSFVFRRPDQTASGATPSVSFWVELLLLGSAEKTEDVLASLEYFWPKWVSRHGVARARWLWRKELAIIIVGTWTTPALSALKAIAGGKR